MSKFHVGDKVRILWDKTPYPTAGMLKVGVIEKLPSHDNPYDKLYEVINVNPNAPHRVYRFLVKEMILISSPTLNGDSL